MKAFIITLAMVVLAAAGKSQELRTRTNEVHLSMKEPRSRTSLPVITWITPALEFSSSKENSLEIVATVQSDIPLKNLKIVLGDVASGSMRGQRPINLSESGTSQTIKQKVTLMDGSNYVEIVAENINGAKVSGVRNIMVGSDVLSAVSADRKDYALLFATDNYDHWTDLVNPVYDANTIARELKDVYGFEVEVVENANQEDVLVKIKDYSKRNYKPQDQLFIFFAGHGQFDEGFGEGYVVAKNSLELDKAKTTYISHSNLRSYINNIACNHILLTMDVCFGGTFDPAIARARAMDGKDELNVNEFLVRKLSKHTRKYITSGGREYVSDGVVGQHSPFAIRFIEALKSRGGQDGILTISEILSFLEKIKQHEPRSDSFGDDEKGSDFVFVAKQ